MERSAVRGLPTRAQAASLPHKTDPFGPSRAAAAAIYENETDAAIRPHNLEPEPDEWAAVHSRHEADRASSG